MPKKPVEEEAVILGRPGNNLRLGIVGMPNVGKSSLFNLLSKLHVPAENFSFCTIDPHEARVPVPDKRFNQLCTMYKPASEVAAALSITDIAGLVAGASEGKGLGNAFLSNIAAVDGIFHVVRAFKDKDVSHYEGEVDPIRDLNIIAQELRLKDIERVKKLIEGFEKVIERGMDKTKKFDLDVCQRTLALLESGRDVRHGTWSAKDIEVLNEHLFLTAKPVVFLANIGSSDYMKQKNKYLEAIGIWVKEHSPESPVLPFSVAFEQQLEQGDVDKPDAVKKIPKSVLNKIIHTGYKALHLIHYFTCGEDEVRCWTIRRGTKAKAAAGVIHTDFSKGFQSAEIMHFDDLKELGSQLAVRENGKLIMAGKDYVVKDGDICYFKVNTSGIAKKKK